MKIKFSCNKCGENFNVSAKYLIEKDAVICPNCSSEFLNSSFVKLKEGIIKIQKCKDELSSVVNGRTIPPSIDFEIIN